MAAEQFPDAEGAVKTFLRSRPEVTTTAAGTRVFMDMPTAPTFPLVTVQRVGGGVDPSEVPLDVALVDISCWGRLDASGHAMWAELMVVVNGVRSALSVINGRTELSADVDGFGVQEAGLVRLIDPADGRPRYSLTTEVSAMSS